MKIPFFQHVDEIAQSAILKFRHFLTDRAFHRQMDAAFGAFVAISMLAVAYGHFTVAAWCMLMSVFAMALGEDN